MKYSKHQFGFELKKKIINKSTCDEISKWAFDLYLDPSLTLENGLDDVILTLVFMEEGPEFLLTEEQLSALADNLISQQKIKYNITYDDLHALFKILEKINLFNDDAIDVLTLFNEIKNIPKEFKSIDFNWRNDFIYNMNLLTQCTIGSRFILEEKPNNSSDIVDKLKRMVQEILDEYLSHPDVKIQEKAKIEYANFLHCPYCHNVWEAGVSKPMVVCLICNHVLHNPLFSRSE
jgi:hypothetical protein